MTNKINIKDVGAAFSFANLWFFTGFRKLLYPNDFRYLEATQPSLVDYPAILINVLIFTVFFYTLITLCNYSSKPWRKRLFHFLFLIVGLGAFGGLSSEIITWFSPSTITFVNILLPAVVLGFCLIFSIKEKFDLYAVTSKLKVLPLLLLPFFLVICFQSVWLLLNGGEQPLTPASVDKEISEDYSPRLTKKIVLVIFDELGHAALDYAIKKDVDLPEFNRLMNQSLVAQNAFSPAANTKESIPALLTGKLLKVAIPNAPNDITLYPADASNPVSLRESENIISEVEKLGGKTGIIGWYHPYPRIFNEKISYGFWSSFYPSQQNLNILAASYSIFYNSLLTVPLISRIFLIEKIKQEDSKLQNQRNRFLNQKAGELIINPKLNFLYFHFSIPHHPFLSVRHNSNPETYFDSLEVVDDTIKQLRENLEKTDQWDQTTFIVTSDHWWREAKSTDFELLSEDLRSDAVADIRIPFIIKFAGQKSRVNYQPAFNTVISKELILAIFDDKLRNPNDFSEWIEQLRKNQPELVNFKPAANSN